MSEIIAGRFQQQDSAENAVRALVDAGFDRDLVSSFYVSPAGRHGVYPVGGDRDKSPGAEKTGASTATGAAVGAAVGAGIGLAASAVVGPIGVVAGTGVGAYVGSYAGALTGTEGGGQGATGEGVARPDNDRSFPVGDEAQPSGELRVRPSGMLVSVAVSDDEQSQRAIDLLTRLHAEDVESSEGTITAGDWTDFDPLRPVSLVS